MNFSIKIKKYAEKTNQQMENAVTAICTKASMQVIKRTPVDTGRARGNWYATIDTPSKETSETRRQSESEDKAKQESKKAYGHVFHLTNNLPYINRLEKGWSKQAPAGMVRIVSEQINNELKRL